MQGQPSSVSVGHQITNTRAALQGPRLLNASALAAAWLALAVHLCRRGRLEAMGAIFVEELTECPDDRPVVFSAHGVPKVVPAEAARRLVSRAVSGLREDAVRILAV